VKELSPLALSFKVHYKMHDAVSGRWTRQRVRSLCNAMRLTEDELAVFLRIPPCYLSKLLITEQFPGHMRLMLSLLEGWLNRTRLGDPETQVFPTHLL
jgi:transcriptional regulator with XRE-family HTH domain